MATIVNDRDVLLQGNTRDLDPKAGKYMLLTVPTPLFHVSRTGSATPATITLTALPVNIGGGLVSFSTTDGTLTGTGNTRTLAFVDMTLDIVTITASVTDLGQTYTASQTITKVVDGAVGPIGVAGATGSMSATAAMYKWSTVNPGLPQGTSTLSWNVAANTSYIGSDGWYTAVPANPGVAGIQLWTATKPVTAAAGTPTTDITYSSGATLAAISMNGANGSQGVQGVVGVPGIKNAIARAYQWSTGPTPTATGTAVFTWATAAYDTPPLGWSVTKPVAPSLGYTLYEASVGLVDASGATTTAVDWTTANRVGIGYMATNGASGGTGSPGATGNSATIAYTLIDGNSLAASPATSTNSGTTPTLPTWGETRAWTSSPTLPGAGQSVFQSNGIYNSVSGQTTWGVPYLSALRVGQLSAIAADLGTITAGSLNIGNGAFTVDVNGNSAMKSITIKDSTGVTILSSGTPLNASYAAPGTLNSAVTATTIGAVKVDLTNAPSTILNSSVTATSLGAVKTDASNAPASMLNASISMGTSGVLSGGGGGAVTIGGLGYTGALNATNTTNTNQLTDGAGLGTKANWVTVTGTGKPADYATVGAAFGVNIGGQITAANVATYFGTGAISGTYIANLSADKITAGTLAAGIVYAGQVNAGQVNAGTLSAGIVYAGAVAANQIQTGTLAAGVVYAGTVQASQVNAATLSALTATIGTLRTRTDNSGAGIEIRTNQILVFDESNNVRVKIGYLY